MPAYNVFFDTTEGELQYKVTIPDESTLAMVLPELLEGLPGKGRSMGGALDLVCNGQALREDVPLAEQNVRPQDSIYVRSRKAAESGSRARSGSLGIKLIYLLATFPPIWVIHFLTLSYLAGSNGNIIMGIFSAILACGVALGLWYFTETSSAGISELLPFVAALLALSSAVLATQYTVGISPLAWATVLPALLVGVVGAVRTKKINRSTCGIGGELFSGLQFTCPRCGRDSCTSHWNVRRVRCTNCDQREILWLSLQGSDWWERRVGPSIAEGQCSRCRTGPDSKNAFKEQRDLRECANCGLLQCRWCWDLSNGLCADEQGCGWTMPELPSAITTMRERQGRS